MNIKQSAISVVIALFIAATATPALAAPCTMPGSIVSVTNNRVGNFERVIFNCRRPFPGTYSVSTAAPQFIEDGSGNVITVTGPKYQQIRFKSVVWTCSIAENLHVPKVAIKDIKKIGQFEGVVTYVIGYRNASQYITTYAYNSSATIRKVVMLFH